MIYFVWFHLLSIAFVQFLFSLISDVLSGGLGKKNGKGKGVSESLDPANGRHPRPGKQKSVMVNIMHLFVHNNASAAV